MHMMASSINNMSEHITITKAKDKLIQLVDSSVDMASIYEQISKTSTQLILPVCGKRCYNKLFNHRNKDNKKEDSEYASSASWETDGDDSSASSIRILINWLTTEENCSSYFGGIDVNGRTSANRKEAYHHHIRDLIKNENGE